MCSHILSMTQCTCTGSELLVQLPTHAPHWVQLLGIFHGSIPGQCRCNWWHAKREACPCEGAGDFEVVGLYLNRAPYLAQPWALGPVLTAQTLSKHTKDRLTICL